MKIKKPLKPTGSKAIPYMGVSKNKGTPKWMVYFMENPIQMDALGVLPLFLETPIYPNQPRFFFMAQLVLGSFSKKIHRQSSSHGFLPLPRTVRPRRNTQRLSGVVACQASQTNMTCLGPFRGGGFNPVGGFKNV